MTDYNKHLDGLMTDCLRSVQRYFFPSQESQAIAATPAAYTSRKAMPASTAPRPHVPEILPFPSITPQSDSPKYIPSSTAIEPYPDVNKNAPSAATPPRSALSTNLSPAATAPSPFVPLSQSPIGTSNPACASQAIQKLTTPTDPAELGQQIRKDCAEKAPDKKFYIRYRNMTHDALQTELKARGLICKGHKLRLAERLKQDDRFQAEPRTDDGYDTMGPKAIRDLCVRRSIPTLGTVSSLQERLKGHDKREKAIVAAVAGVELRRPAGIERVKKHVNRKDNVPVSRQKRLSYLPEDEITLLQVCVNLKDAIAWGNIYGFWNMVQDTLQMKTGKPYTYVSRHIRILVRKRRAEQQEIERRGKISISRVSAGCRPLLDKWIAGGNHVDDVSPDTSNTPTLIEDNDNLSFDKKGEQQSDSDNSALEVQKRSATDSWLETSCETLRSKRLKHCDPEPILSTSKSRADSLGCWSLSGSSVTSESSFEDESEDEGEGDDNVKGGD